jgi:hypothetical protein
MSPQRCRACLAKNGKSWSSVAESDLQEGICPDITKKEFYICKLTGKKIPQRGRVRIISCAPL